MWINFYPFPLLAGLLIIALAGFRSRQSGWLYLSGLALFGLYLLFALGLMFFPFSVPANWPASIDWQQTLSGLSRGFSINLIPFYFGNMYTYTSLGYIYTGFPTREVVGNLLFTVPFGVGVTFLKSLRPRQIFAWALGVGLALEGAQLVLKVLGLGPYHAVDINDVILNALGVLLGFGGYQAVVWGLRRVTGWWQQTG